MTELDNYEYWLLSFDKQIQNRALQIVKEKAVYLIDTIENITFCISDPKKRSHKTLRSLTYTR